MRYYWFDHTSGDAEAPRLDGLAQLAVRFGALKIDGPPLSSKLTEFNNTVFFVHAGGETGDQTNWENIADRREKRFVVFVSSTPAGLSSHRDRLDVFCIKQSLERVVEDLTREEEKVDQLRKSFEEGDPKWDLFLPLEWPEWVLAGYLVRLAQEQGVTVDDQELPGGRSFWLKVSEEYEMLASRLGITGLSKEALAKLLAHVSNRLAK